MQNQMQNMSEPGRLPQNHLAYVQSQPGGQCIPLHVKSVCGEPGLVPQPAQIQTESNLPPVQPVYQTDQINPVTHQVQPYEAPAAPPLVIPVGVPPGLQYLTMIDQILVHQKMECLEMFTGFETNNQYEIKNSIGQLIYQAKEKTNCFTRNICGSARSFLIQIKDNMCQEVMRVQRPLRCTSCCYPCCLQELEVQAPPGVTIGYVKQNWHPFLPVFSVQGPDKQTFMRIRGPYMPCKCCGDVNFEVRGKEGVKPVGRITKQRGGCIKKCFTDATNFTVQFPLDMEVKMKAIVLGACFLIDFMFFEKGGNLFI